MYYLYYATITNRLATHYTGTTIKHLTGAALSTVQFPVPSFNEQLRIVAKIEELFSDLDAGVAALQRAKANLKRYRAAVLKAAVEGKLTEEWRAKHPDTEPASKLLERILIERRKKWEADQLAKFAAAGKQPPRSWRERYVEPNSPETNGLAVLPDCWSIASLEQISEVGTGTTPSRANPEYYTGGSVPWVMSSAVNYEFVDQASEFVTERAVNETTLHVYPVGTLILALYGEGKTRGLVSELRIEATINQALGAIVFTGNAELIRPFAKLFLSSSYLELRRKAAGGMQPNLNLGIVKRIAVPIPPIDEQKILVTLASERLSQIEAAEAAIETGLARAVRLRQGVLKLAFEGRLVPQETGDGPSLVPIGLPRTKSDRVASTLDSATNNGLMQRGAFDPA